MIFGDGKSSIDVLYLDAVVCAPGSHARAIGVEINRGDHAGVIIEGMHTGFGRYVPYFNLTSIRAIYMH